jgi:hypothetical protein
VANGLFVFILFLAAAMGDCLCEAFELERDATLVFWDLVENFLNNLSILE